MIRAMANYVQNPVQRMPSPLCIIYCHSHLWWRSSHGRGRDGRWLTKNYEFTISWKKTKLKFENIFIHSERFIEPTTSIMHRLTDNRRVHVHRAPTIHLDWFFRTHFLWVNNVRQVSKSAHIECSEATCFGSFGTCILQASAHQINIGPISPPANSHNWW